MCNHCNLLQNYKIICESALLKSNGMEWKDVNPVLWSVKYLPFQLRLSETQNWPLLNPWPIYTSPAFCICTKLELALGESFCPNFGLCLFSLLRCTVWHQKYQSLLLYLEIFVPPVLPLWPLHLSSPQNRFMPPPHGYMKQSVTEFYDKLWGLWNVEAVNVHYS